MKRIALIDSLGGELGGYCNRRIEEILGSSYEYVILDAVNRKLPRDAAAWSSDNHIDAAIPLGSLSSPLDSEQWIREVENFLRQWPETGLPMLAICFGHEALASAFGGKVESMGQYTIEMQEVEITVEGDVLFEGFEPVMRMPVAHSVQVAGPPPGFVTVAKTPDCPVQAMKHESLPIYSVQFHPEITSEVKRYDPDWTPIPDNELDNFQGPVFIRRYARLFV